MIKKWVGWNVAVDKDKVWGVLDQLGVGMRDGKPDKEKAKLRGVVKKLVSLAKNYLIEGESSILLTLADRHGVEVEECGERASLVMELVWGVLHQCKQASQGMVIDYDDMIWLPAVHKLPVRGVDVLMVDESQDTNVVQQYFVRSMAEGGGRVVVIGDPYQAIYGWRGADCNAMDNLRGILEHSQRGVEVAKLTYTRRCPHKVARMAQLAMTESDRIAGGHDNPEIHALPGAPEGVDVVNTTEEFMKLVKPGDLVLCRVNQDLVTTCYQLLKQNRRASIRGRDIGEGLKDLVRKAMKFSLDTGDWSYGLDQYCRIEDRRLELLGERGEGRRATLQEKVECLMRLRDLPEAESVDGVVGLLDRLFEKKECGLDGDVVMLGTVHRCKGLESERVWILRPDLLPHPMAKREWEKRQEWNLLMVAVTRAMKEVHWVEYIKVGSGGRDQDRVVVGRPGLFS
jgi:superfamily I DNA/RNA helicase